METIGTSKEAYFLKNELKRASQLKFNVLISGERGTGKRAIAQKIHCESKRKYGPFICIDLSSATKEKVLSAFSESDTGTLFLKYIEKCPHDLTEFITNSLHLKLIKDYARNKESKLNCRIISSSSLTFEELISQENLPQDFVYTLSEFRLFVPPLRSRLSDMKAVVRHFLYQEIHYKHVTFTDQCIENLKTYEWPGNIKELKSYLLNLVLKRRCNHISLELLPPLPQKKVSTTSPLTEATREFHREFIKNLIRENGGNKTVVAKQLKISRASLYRKLNY